MRRIAISRSMSVSARRVANEIIRLAREKGEVRTPLELLKLVYIAHGYCLGSRNRPLVQESVEAWRYGPVIPDLYRAMKHFGSSPVTEDLPIPFYVRPAGQIEDEELSIIEWTYDRYRKFDGLGLSAMTHAANTPWSLTWQYQGQNAVIAPELIAEHYRKLISNLPN